MSDDGSCELRHVAQYYVTFKCRGGRCNSVVGDTEKHSGIYQNKKDPCAVKVGITRFENKHKYYYYNGRIATVAKVRAGRSRNRGSIRGKGSRFESAPKGLAKLCDPPPSSSVCTGASLLEDKTTKA